MTEFKAGDRVRILPNPEHYYGRSFFLDALVGETATVEDDLNYSTRASNEVIIRTDESDMEYFINMSSLEPEDAARPVYVIRDDSGKVLYETDKDTYDKITSIVNYVKSGRKLTYEVHEIRPLDPETEEAR